MSARRAAAVALACGLALAAPAAAHHAGEEDEARGVVFDGLVSADGAGPCAYLGWEIRAGGRMLGCTHGPDPAPEGVDARVAPSLGELDGGRTDASPIPCIGNGVSGPRVQAVYAHPSNQASRFASVRPLIETWAADVHDIVRESAVRTGGVRDVRFVTDIACRPTVLEVAVSPTAAGSFGTMISELGAQGHSRSDRKYLVWMDATTYCGIAAMYEDDRPGASNLNNGFGPGLVARIDAACWEPTAQRAVAAHELTHTLGAVQSGAPNATAFGHCTDEWDVMCYLDGPGTVLRVVCGDVTGQRRLDCGGNDYFSTAPTPGSWLSAHWNTANSSFLERSGSSPVAPGNLRATGATDTTVTLAWDAAPAASSYWVFVNGALHATVGSPSATVTGLACGRSIEFAVETVDGGGNHSTAATAFAATLACRDTTAPSVVARNATGRRGAVVTLRYSVADAGETRETVTVLRGRRRLALRQTGFAAPGAHAVRWRIPRTAAPGLRFCVRAVDRAGNASAQRCARIALRRRV